MNVHGSGPRRAQLAIATVALALALGAQAQDAPRGEQQKKTRDEASPAEQLDPKANGVLKKMSDYLGNLRAFTVDTEHAVEVVLPTGEKLEYIGASDVSVLRPNHLRTDRKGEVVDQSLFYDGETLTLYGRKAGLYARADAPSTLEETIDFARDELGLEAPAADLIVRNAYSDLMRDVISSRYIGTALIDGVVVDHVAFRGKEVDFQLWVEQGPRPLPRKYVITSKLMEGSPEFTVEMDDWDVSPRLTDAQFEFTPPDGVGRITFLRAPTTAASLR